MTSNKIKIIKTNDGSDTVINEITEETYHSVNGAIAESEHIYINNGIQYFKDKTQLDVFEMGFGTGLNAFLTCIEAEKSGKNINYSSIEKYPIDKNYTEKINYSAFFENYKDIFNKIHSVEYGKFQKITNNFNLRVINEDFLNYEFDNLYDVIFFDAFSFNLQPELWSEEVFSKIFKTTKEGGILLTYSSKGIVKENLRKAGFFVKRIKGFQKHHSILAHKLSKFNPFGS